MPNESMSMPQFTPPQAGGDPNNTNSAPNISNSGPRQESQSQWSRSVSRGKAVKKATSTVINTRSELVSFFRKSGLDLMTSAVEFQANGDFIQSSYVIYPQQNNFKESLSDFLLRYPTIKPAATTINERLKSVQSQMQVISK